MKHKIVFFLMLAFAQAGFAQKGFPFKFGEQITYKIKYGIFTAGEAQLIVKDTAKFIGTNRTMHFQAIGRTTSALKLLVQVNNVYNSYVHPESLEPYIFTENVNEDDYHRENKAVFKRNSNLVTVGEKQYDVPDNVMDIVSSFYFARTLDLNDIKVGEVIHMNYFMEDGYYPLDITYLGIEKVKTKLGNFECLKLSPSLLPGRVFRKDSKMYMWVTNDERKIPVKIEAEILIGSVTMEIQSVNNLYSSKRK
jgi:hypothetical protein